jgi:hypothetical protein
MLLEAFRLASFLFAICHPEFISACLPAGRDLVTIAEMPKQVRHDI